MSTYHSVTSQIDFIDSFFFLLFFRFAVDLKLSIFKKLSNASAYGLPGKSTHGDDIFYVFKLVDLFANTNSFANFFSKLKN